jgi:RNA polymerase sigma-70 factor (ECF subfamily)
VYSVAYRMMGNEHDALDAVQETFLNAYRRAASFRGESALGTWLYRVTINTCLDLLRRRSRTPQPAESQVQEEAYAPDVATQVTERMDLARALRELGDDFREVILMHDVGGVPYEEIARLTGTSIGTIKSRISRGRRKLAELLEQPAGHRTSKDGR